MRAFLTVPSPATVNSLGGERPLDAGSAEVRGRHHLALIPEGNRVARMQMSALPPKADILGGGIHVR